MPAPSLNFKRLVLALPPTAASPGLHFATEMARLLQLDLLALMFDDLGLSDPARLPFSREFRGPVGGWQPIDPQQIKRDLDIAARNVRRSIAAAARELAAKTQFEVMSGPLADTIQTVARAGDILMLAEPTNPADYASAQFDWLTEAVLDAPTAVLLVPARIARRHGPVVAIAAHDDDASIHAAAELAAASGEELIIIDTDHVEHAGPADPSGDPDPSSIRRLSAARGAFPDPVLLNHAFHDLQERLVVITRGAFDDRVPSTIASVRRTPVLLVAPASEARHDVQSRPR